ncbi:MAG: alpha/beta-type small acid-soluble spore protein [Christensenellales bacterium]|jgi:hypothetical protein
MQNNSSSSNSQAKAAAKQHLNNLKFEVANEVGVNLKQGYNGDIKSKDAGYIGGNMVKKMIQDQQRKMSGQ